ncbi:MAG: hypothetical protein ACAH59_12080 [Pseudobdellovibrionaceae bacterium]
MRSQYDNLNWITFIGAFILGASLFSTSVQATDLDPMDESTTRAPAQSDPAKPEKKKTLSFEDELVEGSTQKPELFYLFQKKNFNYKRLIKLRENFLPEMRKTSEDLQRVRSSN